MTVENALPGMREFAMNLDYLGGDKILEHLLVTTPALFPQVRKCLERVE